MKVFSGFRLLKRAFELTRREITASLVILLAATLVLSAMMWLAERNSEGMSDTFLAIGDQGRHEFAGHFCKWCGIW